MAAHEELGFARHLLSMGDAGTARRIARRALAYRPLDPVVWWQIASIAGQSIVGVRGSSG